MTLGTNTHITKEVFKRFPAGAYPYTACAIVAVGGIIWILTPISHTHPTSMLRTAVHSVPECDIPYKLFTDTTARFGGFPQVLGADRFFRATLAVTDPERCAVYSMGKSNDRQSAESFPGNILDGWGHNNSSIQIN